MRLYYIMDESKEDSLTQPFFGCIIQDPGQDGDKREEKDSTSTVSASIDYERDIPNLVREKEKLENSKMALTLSLSPHPRNPSTDTYVSPYRSPTDGSGPYISPRAEKRTYVEFLQDYLDKTITYYYWNKYIASAFWSNISTPVNLTITLLSALTAAQANSSGFLNDTTYANISIAMLLLTTVNTFFRPHEQAQTNMEWLDKWNSVGIMFEDAYYDHMELGTTMALGKTVERYKRIQTEMDVLRREDGPGNINFLTDLIHFISMRTCLRDDTWIEYK